MSTVGSLAPALISGDALLPGQSAKISPPSLYRMLPTPHSFRLIEITAVSPYLGCRMRTVSLDDRLSYRALSYSWGSPNRDVTIWCNGAKLGISSNLADGLKRMHAYA